MPQEGLEVRIRAAAAPSAVPDGIEIAALNS